MARKKTKDDGGGRADIQLTPDTPQYFLRLSKNGHGLGVWIPRSMQKAAGVGYGSIFTAYVTPGHIILLALDPTDQRFAETWPKECFNRDLAAMLKAAANRGGRT